MKSNNSYDKSMPDNFCDYVVVGGGSAGSTISNRLVTAGEKVLLLEVGPRDKSPFIHIPAGYAKLFSSSYFHRYTTLPQSGLGGRARLIPQGRTLGGGSSVNAMIYIRGQAEDYDDWARAGCDGWSYGDVLPFFKRAEGNQRFCNDYHGTDGPLKVSDLRQVDLLTHAFIRAGQQEGIPFTADFNGASQMGVGYNQVTMSNGRRCSSAAAYLRSIESNPLLKIVVGAHVNRIIFDGNRAIGVEYQKGSNTFSIFAKKEVVISAGALQTPKILMLSGIGPKKDLEMLGIKVVSDLPGVGRNLQDHIEVGAVASCDGPYSYHGQDKGLNAVKNGLQYYAFKSGPAASNVAEACAFVNVDSVHERPNIQLHFMPVIVTDVYGKKPKTQPGVTITACVLRPRSRGEVRLRSSNPLDSPVIDTNDFSDAEDQRLALKGLELCRRILRQPAMTEFVGEEIAPGVLSSDQLLEYIAATAETVYHPVGTCRMGVDDAAVVDPKLRVYGVVNLRVVDASIMPNLVSGNTNAPSIMIAEKAADMILNG